VALVVVWSGSQRKERMTAAAFACDKIVDSKILNKVICYCVLWIKSLLSVTVLLTQ